MERTQQEAMIRTLVDRAVAYGRTRKSSQSGFLHFHNGTPEESQHLTIPTYDNFLYALALLRTRSIDNITEAKEFLEKLLPFQIPTPYGEAGSFPLYLHEFPQAKDRFLAVPIATVLCYILRDYGHVIGGELRGRLLEALTRLVAFVENIHTATPPPFRLQVATAVLYVAAGRILDDAALCGRGEALLASLDKTPNATWYSPKTLGQLLSSLALVYASLSQSPWKLLWDHADMCWHRSTGAYIGPPFCQWQMREEPQVTLFDLILGAQSGRLTKRSFRDAHILLEAATVHLTDDEIDLEDRPGTFGGTFGSSRWYLCKRPEMAYAAFEGKPEEVHQNQEKGFHNFVMVWGNGDRVHSVGCQRVRVGGVACTPLENGVELLFSLEGGPAEEDRERNREVVVAVDRHTTSTFSVNGENSMIFHVADKLVIDGSVAMTFEVVEGEGKFLGHRMPGNRASHVGLPESNHFEAYDWLMFLRTVHRTAPCKIALRIEKLC